MMCLDELPNYYGHRNNSFMPYKYRAEKALEFLKDNALPIIGLILAVI